MNIINLFINKINKIYNEMISLVISIIYCLKISFESSIFYTVIRILGNILRPFIALLNSFILKYIIDLLSIGDNTAGNKQILVILIIVSFSLVIIGVLNEKLVSYAQGIQTDLLQNTLNIKMMDKALNADLAMFDNSEYYDKYEVVKRDMFSMSYILWNALDCISALITCIISFAVLCSINLLYGILILISSLPDAIIQIIYTKSLYMLSVEQMNAERKKHYIFHISSTKFFAQEIRLFSIGKSLRERYIAIFKSILKAKKKKIKMRAIYSFTLAIIPQIVIVYITIDIALKVLNKINTVGDFSLYTGILSQLISGVTIMISTFMRVYDDRLKIKNIKSFDDIKKYVIDKGKLKLNAIKSIEFKNVSFTYPNTNKIILDNVSFKIDNNIKLAIVGINGSGKSTLIKLLLRFYEADNGDIFLNGVNIHDYSLPSLRRQFSCYFQEMQNYGFSLRENITISDNKNDISDEEITQILEKVDAKSILEKVNYDLNINITRQFDDNGIELSVGQTQKIALARILHRKSTALILDEPSSSLDPEAEANFFKHLKEICQNKIVLFTSHRLSNIVLADKILLLEDGKVLEFGTHTELIKLSGRYSELYHYQADKYNI